MVSDGYKYNKDDEKVRVCLESEEELIKLVFSDTGLGSNEQIFRKH